MRRKQADTVLFLHGSEPAARGLGDALAPLGLDLRCEAEAEGLELLAALVVAEAEPAAVLLAPDLPDPLGTARRVHRGAPLAQIVFVAGGAREQELHRGLTLAPMIGNHWTLVGDRPVEVLVAVRDAVRSAEQRRQLRTTLDRINLRLAEPPPTDSKRYRNLIISDRYLASILTSAQDAILSVDARGTILTWNRGAETLFGYTEREAVGLPLAKLAAGTAEVLEASFASVQAGEMLLRRELTLARVDGSLLEVDVTVAPVRDEAGRLVAGSLVARDVSERTRAQRALEQKTAEVTALNAELEARVKERTSQLEEANRELETFAYTVSHDLRTPLGGISGFCQALQEDYADVLDETARYYLERIQHNTERMGKLIDDVLALSRISRKTMYRETVDLCELAESIMDELQQAAPRRRLLFRCTAGWAEGDPGLLRIVLENLLGNAWKYSARKEETRITFGAQAEGGETIYFVRDNGVGFDMAYASKLFEVFQRLHSERDYQGTGVGLATVRRIIERHGGRIWPEAEVDEGATFYFTLGLGEPKRSGQNPSARQ